MALYESVWVNWPVGLKRRCMPQIKDLGKFDRKTGELWLEDAGFARFISYLSRMDAGEMGGNRTCARCLPEEESGFGHSTTHTHSS